MIPISTTSKQDWETPDDLYHYCSGRWGPFTIDAAASRRNRKCAKFYDEGNSGLVRKWTEGPVWCNPPYGKGKIQRWVKKCHDEHREFGTRIVLLMPSRTDTKYFHSYILNKASIYFIKGRVAFKGGISAPFPSMLAVYDRAHRKKEISSVEYERAAA